MNDPCWSKSKAPNLTLTTQTASLGKLVFTHKTVDSYTREHSLTL